MYAWCQDSANSNTTHANDNVVTYQRQVPVSDKLAKALIDGQGYGWWGWGVEEQFMVPIRKMYMQYPPRVK